MERHTHRMENGGYESELGREELLAELGRYEDLVESIEAELELVKLNMNDLRDAGRGRSATYTMLAGSKYLLEEMRKRVDEPAEETAVRLENMRRLTADDSDGIHDVEE